MSRKKKNKNRNIIAPIKKIVKEVNSPLAEEVNNITNKICEEEKHIYELEKQKRELTEILVDKILLNNELKEIITKYVNTSNILEEKTKTQNNRKKDLEFKKNKLTEENKTVITEVNNYLQIGDIDQPVGLYNSICLDPVAICTQKNVYLSYSDIRYAKKCLKHKNHKPCKHLKWLSTDEI